MKIKIYLSFVFIFLLAAIKAVDLPQQPKMIFEENKNQWPEQVKYAADWAGGKLFFENNAFTYLLIEKHNHHHDFEKKEHDSIMRYHAFKVNFQNNTKPEISGNNLYPFPRNYYIGNDPSHWAEGVKLYDGISYKNLYPSIDMKVYCTETNLKYDLIIQPGGNPKDISFNYEGTDSMYIEQGNLYIKTSLGYIMEQKPYAYQLIDGQKKEIACSYELKNHLLHFSIDKKYNKNEPLIIDPTLVASTYTGSFADNWGFSATYDNQGNIYSAGIAASAGYPTTLGAFDNTFNGGMPWTNTTYPFDITIIKYNPTGSAIMFSTYYGGSQNEQPHSMFVNNNNELFVAGRTNSTNFPTTAGAYDVTYNGGYDMIVGKFNTSGALLASTFVGGTGDDGVNIIADEFGFGSLKFNYADDGRSEIILNNNSEVFIAASTRSTNFPTTAGTYDATLDGAQDGCVIKLNSTLSNLMFSSYFGGTADDAAYGIKLSSTGNVYITGGTASFNLPTTSGVIHSSFQGGMSDGFIAAFNPTATSLLYSTYLGTSAYDQSYFIEITASDDVYVYGQTMGAYPVSAGVYSNPNSSQFIHKLNSQLNTSLFSTVIGSGTTNPNISPTAFLVDSCQSIYISGWGRCALLGHPNPSSNLGMPITSNAFQSTTDGCDFYFMVLRPNAQSLLYATFFGENSFVPDHVDGGTSRFDKRGFIYHSACASCWGNTNFPTTPTAWSRHNNSFNCNNAVVKMDLTVKPDAIATIAGSPVGCAPYTITFNSNGSQGTNFKWDFGDGSPTATVLAPTHTYPTIGTYTISLTAGDTTGTCGKIDTARVTITVVGPPTLQTSQTPAFCNGSSNGTATVVVTDNNTPYTYAWSNGQTAATATGLTANTYTVTVANSIGCPATATATVAQPPPLSVNTTFTNVGCFGATTGTATATPNGGSAPYSYVWLPGGYTTASVTNLGIGNYTVTVTDSMGCTATATANITQPPALAITATTTNANCSQANGSATVTGTGGFAPYTWLWSGGQTTATVNGLAAGTYTVTITDVNLCTTSQPVSIANISGPTITSTATNVSCSGKNDGSATITASGVSLPFTFTWNNGQTTPTASNLAAGIYSIVVTDANNCSATTNVTITEPTLLLANTVMVNPTCYGFTDGSLQVSPIGGTPPYSYVWATNGNPTTAILSNIGDGTYNVTITDANGCIQLSSGTISNPIAINASITSTSISCFGKCDGTATVTVNNGFAPYTFAWNNNTHQATPTATSLCAGSYTVAITDAHGCPANAVALFNSPDSLTLSLVSKGNPTCFGLCNGFMQIAPAGGTAPYTYSWSSGNPLGATDTALCADSIRCNITDNNGCTASYKDSLIQPNQLTGAVTINKIPCNGVCDGHITANYSGGTLPYNYLWQPGLQTTNSPTGLCAGTNTVTITDANGCNVNGSIDLISPAALTINVSTTNTICGQANGSACVTVGGGTPTYKYQWNSGATDTLNCILNITANTYNVTVKDAMGCIITTNANINNITSLTVTVTDSTNVTCNGFSNGTATTSISGGVAPFSLLWTPDGQTIQNPTNLKAGINTLTVTDNVGCVISASVHIAEPSPINTAIVGLQNASCFGVCDGASTVLYGGGTAPLSIVWSTTGNPTTASLTNLCTGTYSVTITDGAGCTKIDSSTIITQPTALQIQNSSVTDITCFGDNNGTISTNISGGTPFYTFSWTPNVSNGSSASNLPANNYTLVISDLKNCSTSQSFTINEPTPLTATSSSNPAACSFSNGDATFTPIGGTSPYTYQWNDINIQTTAQAYNLSTGTYMCVIRDTNNCTITGTVIVGKILGPGIDSVTSTNVLCNGGNTGTATVFTTPALGTTPFTYSWNPTAQTTATATGLSQGSYNVLVTDANGCTTNGNVIVNQPSPIVLIMNTPTTICYGDSIQMYAQATGGTPNYTYTWTGASGSGFNGGGPHLVSITANTIYTSSVTDANGCAAGPNNTQISVPLPLTLTPMDTTICDGSTGTVSVIATGSTTGNYSYTWSNGATTQSIVVNPPIFISPVHLLVTVKDGCAPPTTDSATVTVLPIPTGTFNQSDTSGCEPLTVNFVATSNSNTDTYTWHYGNGSTSQGNNSSYTYSNDSVYHPQLTITSAGGCSTTINSTSSIIVNPLPIASFTADPNPASPSNPTVNFTDISGNTISSWLWSFGDTSSASNTSTIKNPTHTYNGAGTFNTQLIVTNTFGCLDTAYLSVLVGGDVIFPNAFTPDPNGPNGGAYRFNGLDNNVFFPYASGVIGYKLEIYDRWGELIFESDDLNIGWDGYYRGKLCQQDVYVWKAYVKLNTNKTYRLVGDVTLLR